ncbi:MAG: DUF5069 domain-containing protein [Opitutae bacterium]|nr:DUF5069 domain-containing protein [Opitutae bacterium]
MQHYDFSDKFRTLYDKAVKLYAAGQRDQQAYFTAAEKAFLAASGIGGQAMYDYAEDHCNDGEPGYDRALAIESVRRDYFVNVQHGQPSTKVLDVDLMPAKTDAIKGIEWLPRIIPKTKAKLRGELPSALMYCCGGDRRFFKEHDIHPAEFLSVVWRNGDNDTATVDWVVRRNRGKS